jgi:hypothetical protein
MPTTSSKAFLKTTLEAPGPLYLFFVIQNVGRSAAIDAEITFLLEPSEFKRTVLFPIIAPNQKIRFSLPDPNMKEMVKKYNFLKTTGQYKEINGEKSSLNDCIDIKKVVGSWLETSILLYETPLNSQIGRLVDKIERLDRTIQKMLAFTNGVLIKTPEDQEKELNVIEQRFKREEKPKER